MAILLANNASSTLAASISSGDTTIVVQSGDAALFPTLSPGDWFPVTLVDSSGNREIVKVTARTGATMTVVRGQESTSPRAFAANDRTELRLTAGVLEAFALDADVTAALTAKLDLDGSAPMTGPLVLSGDATDDLQAIPKQQMDAAISGLGDLATQDSVTAGQIDDGAVTAATLAPSVRSSLVQDVDPAIRTASAFVQFSAAT